MKNYVKLNNLENEKNLILQFGKSIFNKLKNYQIFRVFKWFLKNEKLNSKIKLSNNLSFVTSIFTISKFRNIGCSTFRRSKFRPPPVNFQIPNLSHSKIVFFNILTLIQEKNFLFPNTLFFILYRRYLCNLCNHTRKILQHHLAPFALLSRVYSLSCTWRRDTSWITLSSSLVVRPGQCRRDVREETKKKGMKMEKKARRTTVSTSRTNKRLKVKRLTGANPV